MEQPLLFTRPSQAYFPTPQVDWKWYLGRSSDLSLLGELNAATKKKISVALNNPESASFSINVLEDVALKIDELSTCLLAYRNGKLKWSGPVWTVDDSLPDGTCTVACVGWFELLNKRVLKCGPNAPPSMPTTTAVAQTYTAEDQTTIMADLFARTLLDSPFLNPSIRVGNVPSTVENGGERNITYQQFQNIGQAILNMANVENGFDFRLDPATMLFNMYYSLVGADVPGMTIRGRGQHRGNTVFGYKWGPQNLSKLKRFKDGSKVVNDMYVLGQVGLGKQEEPGSINEYGKFSGQTSLSDVVSPTILAAYAAAQVALYSQPIAIHTFDVMPYSNQIYVPQPFVDYDVGDIVGLVSRYGRVNIPELGSSRRALPVRLFAFDVEIGEEGQEEVKNVQTVYTTS